MVILQLAVVGARNHTNSFYCYCLIGGEGAISN